MALKGSCLCRRITYEAQVLSGPIRHCHCTTCRKAHASAYTTSAGVQRSQLRILRGQDDLTVFESSPGKFRYFCRNCGTHVFAERPEQQHITLRVATLDDNPGERPSHHVWTAHDVAWLAPDCPAHEEAQP